MWKPLAIKDAVSFNMAYCKEVCQVPGGIFSSRTWRLRKYRLNHLQSGLTHRHITVSRFSTFLVVWCDITETKRKLSQRVLCCILFLCLNLTKCAANVRREPWHNRRRRRRWLMAATKSNSPAFCIRLTVSVSILQRVIKIKYLT